MPTELLPPAVREQFLYGSVSPKKESFPEKRFWRPKGDAQNAADVSIETPIKRRPGRPKGKVII